MFTNGEEINCNVKTYFRYTVHQHKKHNTHTHTYIHNDTLATHILKVFEHSLSPIIRIVKPPFTTTFKTHTYLLRL